MINKIIDYIEKNRVSTTEIADALGKRGKFSSLNSLNKNIHLVGKIKTIFASDESNYYVHKEIVDVQKNDVVQIFTHNCKDRAIIGDLICKYLILYKQAKGIIVDGNIRDYQRIKKEGYPLWYKGVNPIGCVNNKRKSFPLNKKNSYKKKYDNAIAICDDGGVVIIDNSNINKSLLDKLAYIEGLEDIWYYCLDHLKMSTYDIVCKKKYLKNKSIPKTLKKI